MLNQEVLLDEPITSIVAAAIIVFNKSGMIRSLIKPNPYITIDGHRQKLTKEERFNLEDPLQIAGLSAETSHLFRRAFKGQIEERLEILVEFGTKIEQRLEQIKNSETDSAELILALARKIYSFWAREGVDLKDKLALTFEFVSGENFDRGKSLSHLSFYINPFDNDNFISALSEKIWNICQTDDIAIIRCIRFLLLIDKHFHTSEGLQILLQDDSVLQFVVNGTKGSSTPDSFKEIDAYIKPHVVRKIVRSQGATFPNLNEFHRTV